MKNAIYKTILNSKLKKFVLLIDPDKHNEKSLAGLGTVLKNSATDFIFIGGSLVSEKLDSFINILRTYTTVPVILFPGSLLQLSDKADGILLLSLISGRNAEYLIGNHVLAAPFLKKSKMEVIPTGYILLEDSAVSSVEYISNTKPIPRNKTDLIVATAIAGEFTGNKLLYLEAGSGAKNSVDTNIIKLVKNSISIPLIIGGGMKTPDDVQEAYSAGADIVVVGTAIEENPDLLIAMAAVSNEFGLV
jgi:phosphoglycerol geranylgeranyltransferase